MKGMLEQEQVVAVPQDEVQVAAEPLEALQAVAKPLEGKVGRVAK